MLVLTWNKLDGRIPERSINQILDLEEEEKAAREERLMSYTWGGVKESGLQEIVHCFE